ncbi:MAG: hypothetical protein ABI119_12465 [Gemmatimonadaceae bacterium]
MSTAIHTLPHLSQTPDCLHNTAHRDRISRLTLRQWISFATTLAAATVMTVACADAPTAIRTAPVDPSASVAIATAGPSNYTIVDLGTLGGSFSIAFDINNAGRVSGAANTSDENQHAFAWINGHMTDLGTLGGANSQGSGRTDRPELAILSETADNDPLNENFCGFNTALVCRAGVWRRGVLRELPTLGGTNATALTTNVRGEIIGAAEDGVLDASCVLPQKSHFQAVTWNRGEIKKLPPLPGDEVGFALRANDNGQVVGSSGLCSNTTVSGLATGPHAVLWDHGSPINLGNLGDPSVNTAASINNRGEVIGGAGHSDGTLHPFLWTRKTGMRDLGLMSADPADAMNIPFQNNDRSQIVGASCDATQTNCRGYLWQNGVMTDLNDLLPPDSPLYIVLAQVINESGQISGLAVVNSTGQAHAFLATPTVGKRAPHTTQRRLQLPENVRKLLGKQFGKPFGRKRGS